MPISHRKSAVVRALRDEGFTKEEIGEKLELSQSSVRRYLRDSKQLKNPKILLIDIETAPSHGRFWQPFKTTIQHFQITKEWFIICWSAKWLGTDYIMSDCVTPEEAIARDDKRVTESIWKIMNESDVLVAHNLIKFDKRKLYARFIQNKLPKPRDSRVIDTLTQSKQFAFSYHKLDYLNSMFSLRMKEDTDYELWVSCEAGDVDALAYMLHYCQSDINALEDLYLTIRPWMTSHPNLSLYVDDNNPMCPHCLSQDIIEDGVFTTNVSVFRAYRCMNPKCGATPRGRKSLVSKEKKEGLLVSTVR